MDSTLLESLLAELSAEISQIESQLGPLQTTHDALFRKVAQFELENKHKNLAKPQLPKLPQPPSEDPHLIHFSYFDDSIQHFFAPAGSGPVVNVDARDEKVLHHIDIKTRNAESALQELLWRLGGVSAFPINNRLYDDSSDALLGLRFDVLSHTLLLFLLPHYIILRRREDKSASNLKWLVFRYTTPPYVPLAAFSHLLLENNLHDFVHCVRECLVYTQYKHDKFQLVAEMTYHDIFGDNSSVKFISSVEKDLECNRVLLQLVNHSSESKQLHSIELQCGESEIRKVNCQLVGGSTEDNLYVESLLSTSEFSNFSSSLKSLATYLRNHALL